MNPLIIAALNMGADILRMNTISHNLANSTTAAFKKDISVSRPFSDYVEHYSPMADRTTIYPVALQSTGTVTDFRPGALRFTGNPLDVAVQDSGFFEVASEQGPLYTRSGNFRLDSKGRLVTESGLPVIGTGGEIVLTTTKPVIDSSGAVFENGKQVAQLKTVRFSNSQTLVEAGAGLYAPGPDTSVQADGYTSVRQGYVESSNVNSMTEMVRMIETMRHFEANQRVIQAYDQVLENVTRKIGDF